MPPALIFATVPAGQNDDQNRPYAMRGGFRFEPYAGRSGKSAGPSSKEFPKCSPRNGTVGGLTILGQRWALMSPIATFRCVRIAPRIGVQLNYGLNDVVGKSSVAFSYNAAPPEGPLNALLFTFATGTIACFHWIRFPTSSASFEDYQEFAAQCRFRVSLIWRAGETVCRRDPVFCFARSVAIDLINSGIPANGPSSIDNVRFYAPIDRLLRAGLQVGMPGMTSMMGRAGHHDWPQLPDQPERTGMMTWVGFARVHQCQQSRGMFDVLWSVRLDRAL